MSDPNRSEANSDDGPVLLSGTNRMLRKPNSVIASQVILWTIGAAAAYYAVDQILLNGDRFSILKFAVFGVIGVFAFLISHKKKQAFNDGLEWQVTKRGLRFNRRPFVPIGDISSVARIGNDEVIIRRRKRGFYTIRMTGVANAESLVRVLKELMAG